ncbi:hypothetical protein ACIBEA_00650 [Streptomyces sp. NPDC051555]|uniref:hypothetical protein n=1 Tax=Streptomyces sp. NPDC051555 TaxID=3365657 RepID=UPI0037907FD1
MFSTFPQFAGRGTHKVAVLGAGVLLALSSPAAASAATAPSAPAAHSTVLPGADLATETTSAPRDLGDEALALLRQLLCTLGLATCEPDNGR